MLRDLHFQRTRPQGRRVRASRGAVYDVAVDINRHSPTCGTFVGVELTDDNHRQLWIPPGYVKRAAYHHGYFWSDEAGTVEKIRASGAQLLFVAITSPNLVWVAVEN